MTSCHVPVVSNMDNQLIRIFNLDFSENHVFAEGQGLSVEDHQFLRITEEGTVIRDGRYVGNLPLWNPTVSMTNNNTLAVQQPKSMRKSSVLILQDEICQLH